MAATPQPDLDAAASWWPASNLEVWPDNPIDHPPAQVDDLRTSIRENGWGRTIVAHWPSRLIIAGHGTHAAALAEIADDPGWQLPGAPAPGQVPVRFMAGEWEEFAEAMALADNHLPSRGRVKDAVLAVVLARIEARRSAGLRVGFHGFKIGEVTRHLRRHGADGDGGTPDPGATDPPPAPQSQLGNVYELGPHRLLCGNSADPELAARVLAGRRLGAIMADPPYGMNLDTRFDKMHSSPQHRETGDRFDPVIGDDRDFDPAPWFDVWQAVEQFWFGADYYRRRIPDGGSWVVWDKRDNDQGMNLDDVVGSEFELCWSAVKHKRSIARILWSGHHGMQRPEEDTRRRVHPNQKPVALVEWIFDRWVPDGATVGVPFGGSGVELIACARTERTYIGAELSPAYCDVIRRRWTAWAADAGVAPGPGALA